MLKLDNERLRSTYIWIVNHDESRTFKVLYIVLAVVLSIFVSLFWLVVIVTVHLVFELVRQHHHCSGCVRKIMGRSFWHLKLDLSFIAFSFVVDAYTGVLLGIAGLEGVSGIGRVGQVGIRTGARFGGYDKAIRGVVLSADDIARTTSAAIGFRGDMKNEESGTAPEDSGVVEKQASTSVTPESVEQPVLPETTGSSQDLEVKWTRSGYASIFFGVICVALLFLTPWLIGMTYDQLLQMVMQDLQPFPP
ncbi:MAG: hypothetical protein C4K49_12650 [Candidatus Thorarchaeota archaeon]|nr:MAG: hypothetical protein C4K49_12650 [Candidatus Thorarchaeota archaeon]